LTRSNIGSPEGKQSTLKASCLTNSRSKKGREGLGREKSGAGYKGGRGGRERTAGKKKEVAT